MIVERPAVAGVIIKGVVEAHGGKIWEV